MTTPSGISVVGTALSPPLDGTLAGTTYADVSIPAGQPGDTQIIIASGYATAAMVPPAGWQERHQGAFSGSDHRAITISRLLTSAVAAGVVRITSSAWFQVSALCWCLRGLTGNVAGTPGFNTGTGNPASIAPAVFTPAANTATLWVWAGRGSNAKTLTLPTPAGLVAGSAIWTRNASNFYWSGGLLVDGTTVPGNMALAPSETSMMHWRGATGWEPSGAPPPPPPGATLRVWDGSQWLGLSVAGGRAWDGSQWRELALGWARCRAARCGGSR